MRVYIYGVGQNGKRILYLYKDQLGITDAIDNYFDGESIYGCRVLPLNKSDVTCQDLVIISTDAPVAASIASELRKRSINRVFFWCENEWEEENCIIRRFLEWAKKQDIDQILSSYMSENAIIKKLFNQSILQRDYLREQIEPVQLSPAEGELRKKQLRIVESAYAFFNSINISLHPVLGFGSLLGFVRHNGFIPWDDDLDFLMCRNEYNKLKELCADEYDLYVYSGIYYGYKKEFYKWIDNILLNVRKEIIVIDCCSNLQIYIKQGEMSYECFDVFSIDQFIENYQFDEHKKKLLIDKDMLHNMRSEIERFEYLNRRKHEYSSFYGLNGGIYYGIDNAAAYIGKALNNDDWLDKESFFPLKQVQFENRFFWVPNDPDTCLRYFYGNDYNQLPNDFLLHSHDVSSIVNN